MTGRLVAPLSAACLLLGMVLTPAPAKSAAMRRFVLAAGVNNGGVERKLLRYAVSDAESFAQVLTEMGGLDPADCILLRNPDLSGFDAGLRRLGQQVEAAARWGAGRLEVIVYYSGHADELGLLVGGRRKRYAALREDLERIPADVHIAILDACASGSITRTKGGARHRPFLVDESANMRGYAFLTSSSANEVAQESDRIQASFFTHYLVSGMRGAADVSGDGRVTLTEAYQFAFDETLARTTGTRGGSQHPNRDIRMNGTGDVVMTDLRHTTAGLRLDASLNGRFYVRDLAQRLVAELHKSHDRAVEIGLEPGDYRVHWVAGDQLMVARPQLSAGSRLDLRAADFTPLERERTTVRGSEAVRVGISENLNLDIATREYTFSLGLFFNYQDRPFRGMQAAWLVNQARGAAGTQVSGVGNLAQDELRGWQMGGMVNWAVGVLQGHQVAGALNIGRQVRGWQVAMSTNVAQTLRGGQLSLASNFARDLRGVQVGVLNAADRVRGWQIGVLNLSGHIEGGSLGLINYSHSGLFNLGVWHDELGFGYMTLRSGSRAFYTTLSIGHETSSQAGLSAVGAGLGTHRDHGNSFVELELEHLGIFEDLNSDRNQLTRLRISLGRRMDQRLSVFAGFSLNQLIPHGAPILVEPWGKQRVNVEDEVVFWPGLFAGLCVGRQ